MLVSRWRCSLWRLIWKEGILVYATSERDKKEYKAKVLELDREKNRIKVHFQKWQSKFDEWLPPSSIRTEEEKQTMELPGYESEPSSDSDDNSINGERQSESKLDDDNDHSGNNKAIKNDDDYNDNNNNNNNNNNDNNGNMDKNENNDKKADIDKNDNE